MAKVDYLKSDTMSRAYSRGVSETQGVRRDDKLFSGLRTSTTITISGKSISIGRDDTLKSVARKIESQSGLSAKVVSTGDKHRLVIKTNYSTLTINDPQGVLLNLRDKIGTTDNHLVQVVGREGQSVQIKYSEKRVAAPAVSNERRLGGVVKAQLAATGPLMIPNVRAAASVVDGPAQVVLNPVPAHDNQQQPLYHAGQQQPDVARGGNGHLPRGGFWQNAMDYAKAAVVAVGRRLGII